MSSNLNINDLPATQDLDQEAMSTVTGGNAIANVGGNAANVAGGGTFSPTTVAQLGPVVTNADASTHLKLDMPQALNIGGQQIVI